MGFVHLHVYSGYSFLQSGLTPRRIIANAVKNGATYVAICDKFSLAGAPEIVHLAKERSLKAVLGADLIIEGNLFSCFIESEEGYRNLLYCISSSTKKELTLSSFQKHTAGLHVVLNALESKIHYLFLSDEKGIEKALIELSKGITNFYLGLPYGQEHMEFCSYLRKFATKYPYTLLAFPSVRYLKGDDAIVTSILQSIESKANLESKQEKGEEYYLENEKLTSFFTLKELEQTETIAEACSDFNLIISRGSLIKFPCPNGLTSEQHLTNLAKEGLAKLIPNYSKEYEDRLNYELDTIIKMGYADYFLIVSDYVNFARTHGVHVGPGRGSSAGSLVAFSLQIVKADPIKHGCLFERFLNPERQSMPDIDVDFADIGRERVVNYLKEKYGENRVAHIMTSQTIAARQSLIDIGRIYGYKDSETKLLTSSCDTDIKHTLGWNYRYNPKFKNIVDSDQYYKDYVSLAGKIESLPRQRGLHAAGIVLNQDPLDDILPIIYDESIGYIEQYDKDYLQEQGFLKMDLLGLRDLTLIDNCLDLIRRFKGIEINCDDIPYEDEDAIRLIASGKTMGVCQLESKGMKDAIRQVKPTCLEDVCAIIALYRPGPMENIPSYARRKAGKEKITYLAQELEPILSSTYGIIVYQEQIMQIVCAFAGFSFAQADIFRRAISHKDEKELVSLHSSFIEGCKKMGKNIRIGEQIFSLIKKFADYGFNKSHSLSYSILACQMAYLKAYYPLEFYSTILEEGGGGKEKLPLVLGEIRKAKIPFYLPSINESGHVYEPKENGIMLPLSSISGLNSQLINGILDEREQNGPFSDIFDFAIRTKKYNLRIQDIISLIDAGSFDEFNKNRASLRSGAPSILKYAEIKVGLNGQGSLLDFDLPKPSLIQMPASKDEDLQGEKRVLGRMISGSPLDSKKEIIASKRLRQIEDLEETSNAIWIAAIVESVKAIVTKKGHKMAFVSLYDASDSLEVTLFEEVYSKAFPLLQNGKSIAIKVEKDKRRDNSYLGLEIEEI